MLVLATGFKTHGFVAPMEIAGADGRTLAEDLGGRAARLPRDRACPGFPNLFLLYGPNTNGGTGSVIYTIEAGDGARARGAARARARRRAAHRGPPRRPPSASTASCARALAGTVWHTGCTNWYVDEHGNDPNQWPWTWRTYRKRAARLEPGAYRLA